MAERKVGYEEFATYDFVTTNSVTFEKGHHVCGDVGTGKVKPGVAGDATLIVLGPSRESKAGDGTVTVSVELATPARCYAMTHSGMVAADVFKDVYFNGSDAVTLTSSGNSRMGRLFGFNDFGQALVAVNY